MKYPFFDPLNFYKVVLPIDIYIICNKYIYSMVILHTIYIYIYIHTYIFKKMYLKIF